MIPNESPRHSKPRLILVDDNIRDVGGHYYELATLLLSGAEKLGYQPVLATHARFDEPHAVCEKWQLHRVFHTRRLVRWSLGVDGDSNTQRDLSGAPIGGSGIGRLWTKITDRLVPPAKRPQRMLDQWADDLSRLLASVNPSPGDSLLINTGDDFAMLALASAIKRANIPAIRIDVIFHFALYESNQTDRTERLGRLGRQLQNALAALRPHDVHLHATTAALASQLKETQCGTRISSIPYPTRPRKITSKSNSSRLKTILAGLPRAEKGRGAIAELLSGVERRHLHNGRFQISMQMPAKRWQSMIPTSLHPCYRQAADGDASGPLEVMTSNLSTGAYHAWLDTADLGMFLYDRKRYVARCSGVLLEMFARGIPVIVPDGCWLADQVRLAGGYGSIGLIYQDRAEIPELMQQFSDRRDEFQAASIEYAATIAKRHDGKNSLVQMGITSVDDKRHAA